MSLLKNMVVGFTGWSVHGSTKTILVGVSVAFRY